MAQVWQGRRTEAGAPPGGWHGYRRDPAETGQPRMRHALALMAGNASAGRAAGPEPLGAAGLVDAFVDRLIDPDGEREAFIAWATGAVPDMLALLTPAARRLGDMWIEDECSFCDVTIGMHRLTLLLIEIEKRDDAAARPQIGARALIAPSPGDQHGFGTALVGLFLRRAGWDVTADVCGDVEELAAVIAARPFELAGFSVGHERAIEPVTALIGAARRRSRNPGVVLAVGGPMIVGNPDLARRMGADLWADDAETLLAKLADPLSGRSNSC